ncbi:MAG: NTP transferase domain-containing protein [Syntrophomonadaceae bacterium]|jgi:molybdopterin-guanine dinucleotide biosynthesis protein A|nr:NTP transferase domain-containing protein [Syntrophomonadaceae bacterium]
MGQYDAVILAGGLSSGKLKKYAPFDNEALIVIGSYPMIYYVYRALRGSEQIRKIVISGPGEAMQEIFKKEKDLFFAEPGEDSIDSFSNALQVLEEQGATENVLILPSDIPFITTSAIDDFIERCGELRADFYYSIVERDTSESHFPGVKRTYVKMRDGVFTGGNLFAVRIAVVEDCLAVAKKLVARRKNPLALARLFGLGLAWKFLNGRLSIREAEDRFAGMLGITGRAVISPFAEVGVDVDKPSDLKLAEEFLGPAFGPHM